ncbi:hypothetical protein GMA8713_05072 [Grimontia marina]|uniref:Protein-export membrane protein SecG n=1 Tax=Grimontia marina TaxID=646534 RepID=A0A128FL87_9GAMM|nr:hypothetical protein GMA8713_05072 [Grimontia marina]
MLRFIIFISFVSLLLSATIGVVIVSHFKKNGGKGRYLDNISILFRGDVELSDVGCKVRNLIRNTFMISFLVFFVSFFYLHYSN